MKSVSVAADITTHLSFPITIFLIFAVPLGPTTTKITGAGGCFPSALNMS